MPWQRREGAAYFTGRQQSAAGRLCSQGCGARATALCDAAGAVDGLCNRQLCKACCVTLHNGDTICPGHTRQAVMFTAPEVS